MDNETVQVIGTYAVAASVAFAIALSLASFVARNAERLGLIDFPNDRSSHDRPTPRGGGIGVAAGVAGGMFALAIVRGTVPVHAYFVVAGALAIAVLGAIDDRVGVSAGYRLGIQTGIAVLTVFALGPADRLPLPSPLDVPTGLAALPLTVLWLVAVTNFFNFMDGIDGLAVGQAIASCAGVAIAAWSLGSVQIAVVTGAAATGFLVLNRPPARIFLGDVGSMFLGYTLAALPLLAPPDHIGPAAFAVGIGLALFLLDPVETVTRIVRSGHRIGTAHRLHAYQLLSAEPSRRGAVAAVLCVAGFVLAMAGAAAYRSPVLAWPALVLALAVYGIERLLVAGAIRAPVAPRR